jgi:hypothetical protein
MYYFITETVHPERSGVCVIKKKRIFHYAAALFFFCIVTVCSAASPPELWQIRKYFEWGEYDTLLQALEPCLHDTSLHDSTYLAECHKYLGVAYFAKSRIGDARIAFQTAYRYNPGISLDTFYVSREIADLFNDAISESSTLVRHDAQQDSVLRVKDWQLNEKNRTLHKIADQKRQRLYLTYGISCYAISAICGGISLNAFNNAQKDYSDYQKAASSGDMISFTNLSNKIKRNDAVHVVTLVGGALFLVPGTYFLGKAIKKPSLLAIIAGMPYKGQTLYAARMVIWY